MAKRNTTKAKPLKASVDLYRDELIAAARHCFRRARDIAEGLEDGLEEQTESERVTDLSRVNMLLARGAMLARAAEGLNHG